MELSDAPAVDVLRMSINTVSIAQGKKAVAALPNSLDRYFDFSTEVDD